MFAIVVSNTAKMPKWNEKKNEFETGVVIDWIDNDNFKLNFVMGEIKNRYIDLAYGDEADGEMVGKLLEHDDIVLMRDHLDGDMFHIIEHFKVDHWNEMINNGVYVWLF